MTNTDDYIFTSESVSDGHPDKVADQISDALVDAGLKAGDETTRVAVETLVTTNYVVLAGEVKNFNVSSEEVEQIVRDKVKEIGYEQDGFHWEKLSIDNQTIVNNLHSQSGDIGLGTDDFGAGDQGMMFGYACNDNPAMMPAPIYYSHEILKKLKEIRESGYKYMLPDAKAQVSVQYRGNRVERVDQVVVSHQHTDGFEHSIKMPIKDAVNDVLRELVDEKTIWHINPTGKFVIGGPDGDTGVTGRKIIVDTYGGMARHGGGAFSGKDASKVDRSAAYAARYVAKNLVAAGIAERCEIQLSYAIGVAEPTSISVETFGTGKIGNDRIVELVREHFELRPKGLIKMLDLLKPIYLPTAAYGHFGRQDIALSWEQTDKAEALKSAAGI